VGKCPLQKKWSEQPSTPKKLEWAVVHSQILTALQIFWSGLQVHSKNFGVDLRCTPKLLEWTLGALQIFEVNFECIIVYSKVVKNFEVERRPLQIYWSGQLLTPKKMECTLFHSKLECMK
jgi:ribosomal protein L24E